MVNLMAYRRRRKQKSLLDELVEAPWQVSVVIGVAAFIFLRWIFPSIGAGNMFLKPIAMAASSLAWIFASFFFLIGAIVYFKTAAAKAKQGAGSLHVINGLGSRPEPINRPSSIQRPSVQIEPTLNDAADATPVQRGPLGDPLDKWEAWKNPVAGEAIKATEWSLELIRQMEWKRFEDVCQRLYETKGIRSETTPLGPDGGIDIRLYQDDSGHATSIVQCKAWGERFVGVKPVRELLGVMTHEKIGKAFFMTSGRFSDDAKEVAKSNRITLIDGEMLLMMIKRLPEQEQKNLLDFAVSGDFTTPTCPSCGIKMKHIPGKAGRADFWGCINYPRCRQMLGMRRESHLPHRPFQVLLS